jgi:hypothetical protein
MLTKKLLAIISAVFLFSFVAPSFSSASGPKISEEELAVDNEFFEQTEVVLDAIDKLPNGIIKQGPEKIAKWLENKTGLYVTIDENETLLFSEIDPSTQPQFQTRGIAGCVSAVGIALVGNGIPLSKITKVKKAIKALGGVTATVKKVKKAYDEYRFNGFSRNDSIKKALNSATKGLAGDTKAALLDFFYISGVIANCF